MTKTNATAEEKRRLEALEKKFKENNPDIAVLDMAGMLHFWLAARRDSGMGKDEALETLQERLIGWGYGTIWPAAEDVLSYGASYTATVQDVLLLAKLAQDLERGGSWLTKFRINTYNGKEYIIFKGSHRARQVLTGTRYLATNTKVVGMGVGKLGAAKAISGGMKLTIILTIGFRAVETLMSEEATWHYFIGASATDVVKVCISGGASYIAAALVAAGSAVGTVAVGPLFAAIVVGVAVGLALEYLDDRFGFTQAIIDGLREADENLRDQFREAKRQFDYHHRDPWSTVDFWMRVFGAVR